MCCGGITSGLTTCRGSLQKPFTPKLPHSSWSWHGAGTKYLLTQLVVTNTNHQVFAPTAVCTNQAPSSRNSRFTWQLSVYLAYRLFIRSRPQPTRPLSSSCDLRPPSNSAALRTPVSRLKLDDKSSQLEVRFLFEQETLRSRSRLKSTPRKFEVEILDYAVQKRKLGYDSKLENRSSEGEEKPAYQLTVRDAVPAHVVTPPVVRQRRAG